MKTNEYRKLSTTELNNKLHVILREQFDMRMQRSAGQEVKSHLLRSNRRNIARIKTIMQEKAGAENE